MDKDMLISMLMDGTCLIECHSREDRRVIIEAMIQVGCEFMSDTVAFLEDHPEDDRWMLIGFRHKGFSGDKDDTDRFDLFSDKRGAGDLEYHSIMSRIMFEDAINVIKLSLIDEHDYVLDGFDSDLAQILFCGE